MISTATLVCARGCYCTVSKIRRVQGRLAIRFSAQPHRRQRKWLCKVVGKLSEVDDSGLGLNLSSSNLWTFCLVVVQVEQGNDPVGDVSGRVTAGRNLGWPSTTEQQRAPKIVTNTNSRYLSAHSSLRHSDHRSETGSKRMTKHDVFSSPLQDLVRLSRKCCGRSRPNPNELLSSNKGGSMQMSTKRASTLNATVEGSMLVPNRAMTMGRDRMLQVPGSV